eukprot:2001425-Rhodomonas_salina.3
MCIRDSYCAEKEKEKEKSRNRQRPTPRSWPTLPRDCGFSSWVSGRRLPVAEDHLNGAPFAGSEQLVFNAPQVCAVEPHFWQPQCGPRLAKAAYKRCVSVPDMLYGTAVQTQCGSAGHGAARRVEQDRL